MLDQSLSTHLIFSAFSFTFPTKHGLHDFVLGFFWWGGERREVKKIVGAQSERNTNSMLHVSAAVYKLLINFTPKVSDDNLKEKGITLEKRTAVT